jgi:hypothetical protein
VYKYKVTLKINNKVVVRKQDKLPRGRDGKRPIELNDLNRIELLDFLFRLRKRSDARRDGEQRHHVRENRVQRFGRVEKSVVGVLLWNNVVGCMGMSKKEATGAVGPPRSDCQSKHSVFNDGAF